MKWNKKASQRRRRYKQSGHSTRPGSGRLQQSSLRIHGKGLWVLAVLAIICAAATGIYYLRPLFRTDTALRDSGLSSDDVVEILPPPKAPLRTAQDIAALKKEELRLAETLMEDFQGDADSLVIMGNVWYRYGDAVAALNYYRRALEISPRRADVYDVMGQCALKEGQFEDAIGHWRTALSLNPRLPNAHSNIGHALMISGKSDEAIEELEMEIQISPTSSLAYFLLGQAYMMQQKYEKAKEKYEGAIRVNPEYVNAYYGLLNVCTKLGNGDEAESHSETFKRLKAEERKDLKGRKVMYDDIVETQKHAALTYIEAGRMYLDNGQLQKAEGLLREAVALDPESAVSLEELASLYRTEGKPSKAFAVYKRIGEIEPENAILLFKIGVLSAQLNEIDYAKGCFDKVIALAPGQSSGYRGLALTYLRRGEKLSEARQLAEKALSLEATAANYFAFGWACTRTGDNARALPAIKRAVEMEPENPQYRDLYKLILQRN